MSSHPLDPSATPRRDFLAQLAVFTAAAAVTGACAPAMQPASVAAAPAPVVPRTQAAKLTFDDSWTTAVGAAKHKAVFDAPEADSDGTAFGNVGSYLRGYKEVFNAADADVRPVIVLRHMGTAFAMDDALWAKYGIAEAVKLKDPTTKQWYAHNPFARPHGEQEKAYAGAFVEGMIKRGVTVLACNQALSGFAGMMAQKLKQDPGATVTEFRAGLLPGVILQPSGIYATTRAQEVGCVFMRS